MIMVQVTKHLESSQSYKSVHQSVIVVSINPLLTNHETPLGTYIIVTVATSNLQIRKSVHQGCTDLIKYLSMTFFLFSMMVGLSSPSCICDALRKMVENVDFLN